MFMELRLAMTGWCDTLPDVIYTHVDTKMCCRFGPIPMEAPKQDNGMWQQVQDFGWLRSTPSPNW